MSKKPDTQDEVVQIKCVVLGGPKPDVYKNAIGPFANVDSAALWGRRPDNESEYGPWFTIFALMDPSDGGVFDKRSPDAFQKACDDIVRRFQNRAALSNLTPYECNLALRLLIDVMREIQSPVLDKPES